MSSNGAEKGRKRVVVVGGGFGGLSAAKALAGADVDLTVLDRTNYHLFQPLLYQVAIAGLSPAEIAWPIRTVLRKQKNARVLLGEVVGVSLEQRTVTFQDGDKLRALDYDYLVLATGVKTAYFGHNDWEKYAIGLKEWDPLESTCRHASLSIL